MIRHACVLFPVTNGVMNGISHVGLTGFTYRSLWPHPWGSRLPADWSVFL